MQRGLRARAVRKTYRSLTRRHEVLRGVDLDLAPGEVVGLIGPNGAGKTTLMSCLLGLLHIDGGAITVDGLKNDRIEVRRLCGFLPERMNFDRGVTGRAFLRYMARLAGVGRGEVGGRAQAIMERLAIDDAADEPLRQYSRGMLQRIGLCQALIHRPEFVFLDEPTSGLDPNGVLLVRDLITEQKNGGAAVLLNSHQLSEVEKVCDRVVFLHGGVIARAETLRHVDRIVISIRLLDGSFDAAEVERIAGAAPGGNVVIATVETERDVADMVRRLAAAGAGVVEVRRHVTDLEGIFRGTA
ncbi:MAG TPA: ABC transporter ATP-binding protein [Thermoanaerobaculia bacterium]|nr:ABC transporter ATP-binding protein [Thermoanaerobaculia bacterium]